MTAQPHAHRVKITIDVTEDERIYIKLLATKKKKTISEFIMSFVRPSIPHDEPNAETRAAMRDVKEKKNLTRCNYIKEFWQVVGLDPHA